MNEKSNNFPCRHLILYDGYCGLCNTLNRIVLRKDIPGRFCFATLQSHYSAQALRNSSLKGSVSETVVVIENFDCADRRILTKSSAALFILARIGWPYRGLSIFRILPTEFLDWLYDLISRNRYKFSERYNACPIPDQKFRNRFIDL